MLPGTPRPHGLLHLHDTLLRAPLPVSSGLVTDSLPSKQRQPGQASLNAPQSPDILHLEGGYRSHMCRGSLHSPLSHEEADSRHWGVHLDNHMA